MDTDEPSSPTLTDHTAISIALHEAVPLDPGDRPVARPSSFGVVELIYIHISAVGIEHRFTCHVSSRCRPHEFGLACRELWQLLRQRAREDRALRAAAHVASTDAHEG